MIAHMAVVATLDISTEHLLITKAQAGDRKALETLVFQYQPLANQFAARITVPSYQKADIQQEIRLAIIEAVQTFDFDLGVKLITYVFKLIQYHFSNLHKTLNRDKRRIIFAPTSSINECYGETGKSGNNHGDTSPLEDVLQGEGELAFDSLLVDLCLSVLNGTEIQVAHMLVERMQNFEIAHSLRTSTARISQIKASIARKLAAIDMGKINFETA